MTAEGPIISRSFPTLPRADVVIHHGGFSTGGAYLIASSQAARDWIRSRVMRPNVGFEVYNVTDTLKFPMEEILSIANECSAVGLTIHYAADLICEYRRMATFPAKIKKLATDLEWPESLQE